jgi:hypothetical protein
MPLGLCMQLFLTPLGTLVLPCLFHRLTFQETSSTFRVQVGHSFEMLLVSYFKYCALFYLCLPFLCLPNLILNSRSSGVTVHHCSPGYFPDNCSRRGHVKITTDTCATCGYHNCFQYKGNRYVCSALFVVLGIKARFLCTGHLRLLPALLFFRQGLAATFTPAYQGLKVAVLLAWNFRLVPQCPVCVFLIWLHFRDLLLRNGYHGNI